MDPGGAKKTPLALDFVGSVDAAATVIAQLHRGRKRLVFADSRKQVEELGAALAQQQVDTYVIRGSLSASRRHDAEQAFAQGRDCVIVATSVLALGIDVGDLDHVLQIDTPLTVATTRSLSAAVASRDASGLVACSTTTTARPPDADHVLAHDGVGGAARRRTSLLTRALQRNNAFCI